MARWIANVGSAILLWLAAGGAMADVVVVVSSDSPIDKLSPAELSDIYLGRMTRLPGGGRVEPLDQRDDLPAHGEFYRDYLGRSPAEVKAHWSKLIFTGRGQPPRSLPNGEATADAVAGNPNAIGYIDPGLVDDRLRMVTIE